MAQIKSWTASDELWSKVGPLVPIRKREQGRKYQRKAGAGRKPMPARQVFSAIVYVLRTGVQWKGLPWEFGSASAVHQYFQNWHQAGFFRQLWQAGLAEFDGMHGIAWQWQSADGAMGKAPLATECTGRNPTDRGKKGRKRSLLVDGRGLPLSIAVSGANVHDSKLLDRTLAQAVVQCPKATWSNQQYLCLDAGYVGYPVRKVARKHGYYLRVKSRAEERLIKYRYPDSKPRRWVVERTHSWLNRYRKLPVSFEKTEASYLALLELAAALICWRHTISIYG